MPKFGIVCCIEMDHWHMVSYLEKGPLSKRKKLKEQTFHF